MTWSAEFAVACVPPTTGAALRELATTTGARSMVEVGTGLGVSGLWLLAGAPAGAVLTTIDRDTDLQAMARQAFAAAGHPPGRYRLLSGRAEVLLDRLADAAYDLMFVDVDDECVRWAAAADRVLRPGGLLVRHQPTDGDHALLAGPQWSVNRPGSDLLVATRLVATRPGLT
jgi:predicted O-methyltransferase YrrM